MEYIIWIGTALSCLGLAGLVYCVIAALRAKRAGLDEDEMRARLKRLVGWNMGALLLSTLGLVIVITGLFLG
ncbi:hypothetical protein [Palleronia abyssalis]|uniref:Uncharacterized protein n=1 Tax=Palleronia abyssalis TaxID=1501240 RepID=A0A2R8BUR4_9RHOB|nr:hypothetical protein [Palleronia abyssalis]SPJ23865.1 hypothetical protein PAA8504_01684 [Palleronia abyssalis]